MPMEIEKIEPYPSNIEDFKNFRYNQNTIQCQFCQKNFLDDDTDKFWYLVSCYHCICRGCLIKHIQSNYVKEKGQVKCPLPLCMAPMAEEDYQVLFNFYKRIEVLRRILWEEKNSRN